MSFPWYSERLVVAAEGQVLWANVRVIERSHQSPPRTIHDWRHCLAVLRRKTGALRNGPPLAELPVAFNQRQDLMLRRPGGDLKMVDILALGLHQDQQAVLVVVEMACPRVTPNADGFVIGDWGLAFGVYGVCALSGGIGGTVGQISTILRQRMATRGAIMFDCFGHHFLAAARKIRDWVTRGSAVQKVEQASAAAVRPPWSRSFWQAWVSS